MGILASKSERINEELDCLEHARVLRRDAHELRNKAKAASEQSKHEYQFGSKNQAKVLSNQKASLYEEMNKKNLQAAKLIFNHYNQQKSDDVIDLHELFVHEALQYLEEKLDQCRSANILQLEVITGAGNNSPQHIPRIKPEVEAFARKHNLGVTSYTGHIILDLNRANVQQKMDVENHDRCSIL
jgi:DNA-nicking Smr family endonuclease